jgi:hypothetical protein
MKKHMTYFEKKGIKSHNPSYTLFSFALLLVPFARIERTNGIFLIMNSSKARRNPNQRGRTHTSPASHAFETAEKTSA